MSLKAGTKIPTTYNRKLFNGVFFFFQSENLHVSRKNAFSLVILSEIKNEFEKLLSHIFTSFELKLLQDGRRLAKLFWADAIRKKKDEY